MKETPTALRGKGMSRKVIMLITASVVILVALGIAAVVFLTPQNFEWNGKNSFLGVLLEDKSFEAGPGIEYEVAYLAGIPQATYRTPDGFWFAAVYFGDHPSTGKPVVASWFFGEDETPVTFISVEGNRAPFDPSLTNELPQEEIRVTAKNFLENLEDGRVYPMRLITNLNSYTPQDCLDGTFSEEECQEQEIKYREIININTETLAYIKGERDTAPDEVLVLPPTFYYLSKQGGALENIKKSILPQAEAQSWDYRGYWYIDQECLKKGGKYAKCVVERPSGEGRPRATDYSGIACVYGGSVLGGSARSVYTKPVYPIDYTCEILPTSVVNYSITLTSCTYVRAGCSYEYFDRYCWDSHWKCVPKTTWYSTNNETARCVQGQALYPEWCDGSNGSCSAENVIDETCRTWAVTQMISGARKAGCIIETAEPRTVSCSTPIVVSPVVPPQSACSCGDEVLCGAEQCDLGPGNGPLPSTCSATCQLQGSNCGNGITEPPETCDDGNTTGGDGCSAICRTELPTLSVALTADPSEGKAPLNVDLTATVGGTTTGVTTYQFRCESGDSYSSFSADNTYDCSYASSGDYLAGVQVARGGLTTSDTALISVETITPVDVNVDGGKKANGCYDADWIVSIPNPMVCVPSSTPYSLQWNTTVAAQLASGATSGEIELCDVETATKITLTCGQYEDSAVITAPFIREINPGQTQFNLYYFLRGLFPGFVKSSYAGN